MYMDIEMNFLGVQKINRRRLFFNNYLRCLDENFFSRSMQFELELKPQTLLSRGPADTLQVKKEPIQPSMISLGSSSLLKAIMSVNGQTLRSFGTQENVRRGSKVNYNESAVIAHNT